MYIYGIKDEKAGVFNQPYFTTHDVIAIRMFRGTIKRGDNLISDFPEDYALYRLGYWDDANGKMIQDEQPVRLCSAYEFVGEDNEEEPG